MEENKVITTETIHDYNKTYKKFDIVSSVINGENKAFIATRNVPRHISITDKRYWNETTSANNTESLNMEEGTIPCVGERKLKDSGYTIRDLGIAVNKCVEVKFEELTYLIDDNELIPGQFYRIIDYHPSTLPTNSEDMHIVGQRPFDIIVFALSTNTLCEDAYAIEHNNICNVTFSDNVTKQCYIVFGKENKVLITDISTSNCLVTDKIITEEYKHDLICNESSTSLQSQYTIGTTNYYPIKNYFYNKCNKWKIKFSVNVPYSTCKHKYIIVDGNVYIRYKDYDGNNSFTGNKSTYKLAWIRTQNNNVTNSNPNTTNQFMFTQTDYYFVKGAKAIYQNGIEYEITESSYDYRGVINYMIDENNNECDFDFKNYLFKVAKLSNYVIDNNYDSDIEYLGQYMNCINNTYNGIHTRLTYIPYNSYNIMEVGDIDDEHLIECLTNNDIYSGYVYYNVLYLYDGDLTPIIEHNIEIVYKYAFNTDSINDDPFSMEDISNVTRVINNKLINTNVCIGIVQNITTVNSTNNIIYNSFNNLIDTNYNIVKGANNKLILSNHNIIIGNSNNLEDANTNIIYGSNSILENITNSYIYNSNSIKSFNCYEICIRDCYATNFKYSEYNYIYKVKYSNVKSTSSIIRGPINDSNIICTCLAIDVDDTDSLNNYYNIILDCQWVAGADNENCTSLMLLPNANSICNIEFDENDEIVAYNPVNNIGSGT